MRIEKTKIAVFISMTVLGLASAVQAKGLLKDDQVVFNRLKDVAIASEIRDNCSTIDAREWRAGIYVLGIVRYAKGLGFTMDEIDTFRFDPIEQERLRQATYKYLQDNGVVREDPQTFCALGTHEIATGTQAGKFLKSHD